LVEIHTFKLFISQRAKYVSVYLLKYTQSQEDLKMRVTDFNEVNICHVLYKQPFARYERVSKSFRTGHLEQELQTVQLSTTRRSCIAVL